MRYLFLLLLSTQLNAQEPKNIYNSDGKVYLKDVSPSDTSRVITINWISFIPSEPDTIPVTFVLVKETPDQPFLTAQYGFIVEDRYYDLLWKDIDAESVVEVKRRKKFKK